MHVGPSSKTSKTEAVFFPQPGFFKLPTPLQPPALSTLSLPLITKPPKESELTKRKREDDQYDNTPETQAIILPDGGIRTFNKHFKYLGNYISYSLSDEYYI